MCKKSVFVVVCCFHYEISPICSKECVCIVQSIMCPVPMLCVRKGVNDGTNWTKWTDNCCQKDSRRKSKYVLYSYKVNEEAFVNKPQCRPARKTINQFGHDAGQDQVVNLVEKYFTIKSSPHVIGWFLFNRSTICRVAHFTDHFELYYQSVSSCDFKYKTLQKKILTEMIKDYVLLFSFLWGPIN